MRHIHYTSNRLVREAKQLVGDSELPTQRQDRRLTAQILPAGHLALYASMSKRRGTTTRALLSLLHDRDHNSLEFQSFHRYDTPFSDENGQKQIRVTFASYARGYSYHPDLETHGPTTMSVNDLQITHNILHHMLHARKRHNPFQDADARAIACSVIEAGGIRGEGDAGPIDGVPLYIAQQLGYHGMTPNFRTDASS